jgi:menaquinol-cytochrome c reductase iron-sulfur subunit
MPDDPDRRKFLKVATCALGGGLGLGLGIPAAKLLLDPSGKEIVTAPTEPIDLGLADALQVGAPPRRYEVIAPVVQDAWTSATNVVLGAAWIHRTGPGAKDVKAFSATCPHLGCAVSWEGQDYLCPCHDSRFDPAGAKKTGPSERGLDALDIEVVGDRLRLTWQRFKLGSTKREPV